MLAPLHDASLMGRAAWAVLTLLLLRAVQTVSLGTPVAATPDFEPCSSTAAACQSGAGSAGQPPVYMAHVLAWGWTPMVLLPAQAPQGALRRWLPPDAHDHARPALLGPLQYVPT